jgi:hypothetical protein
MFDRAGSKVYFPFHRKLPAHRVGIRRKRNSYSAAEITSSFTLIQTGKIKIHEKYSE